MAYGCKRFLYKMTFPDGMVYIGVTHDIAQRWANKGANYRGQRVYEAILSTGWDNIKHEILLDLPDSYKSEDIVTTMEKELIRAYEGRCYNLRSTLSEGRARAEKNRDIYENRRTYWTIDGETKSCMEWCALYGRGLGQVMNRMKRYNLTAKEALELPPVPRNMCHRAMEYWVTHGYLQDTAAS